MNITGLGVRVRPSGSRTFICHRKTVRGIKKLSWGPAALRKVEDVRRDCLAAETVEANEDTHRSVPLFRDFVAGPWKGACFDRCKPSAQRGFRHMLKRRLLLAFGSCRLDRITHNMTLDWFESYSRSAPGNANKTLALFGQILNHAIACGHIEANPMRGIACNPRRKITRFLSREEISRLHLVLDRYADGNRSQAQQADIIRLLLLTGCRKSEILHLRREEVKDDRLELADSKTGPRTVLLNSPARQIVVRRMAEGTGPWLFPSVRDLSRPQCLGLRLWYRVRRGAGIEDVRLHDLRHTVASQAVLNGVPLPVVARLLGHGSVRMTMRYAHAGDHEVETAAERVGEALASLMALKCSH